MLQRQKSLKEVAAKPWQNVIIGAGAAGLGAATMFATTDPCGSLLLEAHSAPGGSAGYFARGLPRRIHDAGATQLIEFAPGGLQCELLRLARGIQGAGEPLPSGSGAIPIHRIDHLWLGLPGESGDRAGVSLTSQGKVADIEGVSPAMDDQMRQQLQRFLDRCWIDAQRMWKVFYRFPDFPVHSPGDLFRLLRCVPFDDPLSVPVLLGVLGLSVADVAGQCGIPVGSRAWQLINALLLDTAQNDAQRTPYLVGAMGLSILRRGIVRLEDGMKGLFDPWIRGNQDRGLTVFSGVRVVALRSAQAAQRGGFELDVVASGGDGFGATETISAQNVVAAFPFGALQQLVPPDDLMRKTNTWQRWDGINARSYEWQALALHGILVGDDACSFSAADEPWYLQLFPPPGSGIPHAIYLSCGPLKHDPRQGEHYRVFTASLHTELAKDFPSLEAQDTSQREGEKQRLTAEISALIAAATGHLVKHASLATPTTFGRYTSRIEGRVGGFEASFENFLFRSPPKVIEARGGCRLVVAGDSVFPGQGVVAASMGGVLAWARISGQDPGKFLKLGLVPATNG